MSGLQRQRKLQAWLGPQETFPAGHKHSWKWIPWNPPGSGVMSWLFRCEWKSSAPTSVGSRDLLSSHEPSAQAWLQSPPGSEPSRISPCRAVPAVGGVPGHIPTPFLPGSQGQVPSHSPPARVCSSHRSLRSTWAQVCSPKLPKPFLNHQPGESRGLSLQSPARQATCSPLSSSFQLQAQVLLPLRFCSPRLGLPAPAARGSKGNRSPVRAAVPDLATESPGRSREWYFLWHKLKGTKGCLPKLQQAPEGGHPATSPSQGSPLAFLPFQAHQQDQGSWPCHRASLRSVPPQHPPAAAGGPWLSAGAPPTPTTAPHFPLECVLLERCASGKTAAPNCRPRGLEEASGEEEESR